jgi:hypothetical protein
MRYWAALLIARANIARQSSVAQRQATPVMHALHSDCSYVKADTQQVDLSADMALLIGTIVAVDPHHEGSFAAAIRDPICRADLTSTQLFVWHCALII